MNENFSKNEILLNQITRDLIQNFSETAKRAIQALFLLNAGGITVTLGYLNSKPLFQQFINYSFVLFLMGFILWIVVITIDYFTTKIHMNKAVRLNAQVLLNEISKDNWVDSITEINSKYTIFSKFATASGCLSLFFGLIGIVIGIVGFFNNQIVTANHDTASINSSCSQLASQQSNNLLVVKHRQYAQVNTKQWFIFK